MIVCNLTVTLLYHATILQWDGLVEVYCYLHAWVQWQNPAAITPVLDRRSERGGTARPRVFISSCSPLLGSARLLPGHKAIHLSRPNQQKRFDEQAVICEPHADPDCTSWSYPNKSKRFPGLQAGVCWHSVRPQLSAPIRTNGIDLPAPRLSERDLKHV